MQKIIICLLFVALASCQYLNLFSYTKDSCAGNANQIVATKTSACVAIDCISVLVISTKSSCGKVADAFPGSTVYYTYSTVGDCSGDPDIVSIYGGCTSSVLGSSSYNCVGGVVTTNTYTSGDCSGTPSTNYSYPTGNCTGALSTSYKYTCGGIVTIPNFLMLLALLAISLLF